ncbi:MAG TPA: hypothetical protein DEG17_05155 [Cyanobacteria bacterium UBA11149]|nr:hypothetical protein [Cyanobacteria bacterium UBA11367]HBE59247.1 hypothetical protein [Cyanobacteria bacterium UBA11366]HBK62927.1 hypothetical protein [Cyanobacteria bacterium UBA11166]HBR76863.1 hypothetical protein [Cyanobacteria bacterium UBA11159]HBS69138.1 hypothetical protein [Cyanobacteria bacterium UBA11153]HBW88273.1 hypothetical protein [Cyanobacteria bacterium UBA11149]HCA97135.1 hypothetical protein [Cyanobacteria bacterium UBA9226]
MKIISYWSKSVALCALISSTSVSFVVPATAVGNHPGDDTIPSSQPASVESQAEWQLAQTLAGECRAAKQRIFVYSQRSEGSQTLGTVDLDGEVTLADSGSGGWIAISAPFTGYVQANNLKPCKKTERPAPSPSPTPTPSPSKPTPTTPPATSSGGDCRKVKFPEGLVIRQNPNSGAVVGRLMVGNTVRLANPRRSEKDSEGRTWVQISSPKAGWISSGFPEGNLGPEISCQ